MSLQKGIVNRAALFRMRMIRGLPKMSKLDIATSRPRQGIPQENKLEDDDNALVRFDEFLELIPDATIGSRADGTIILANREAENVLGYPREQLIGMSVFDLTPERLHTDLRRDREDFFNHPQRRTI